MQAKQNRGARGTAGMYQSMTKRFDGKDERKVGFMNISFRCLVVHAMRPSAMKRR